MLYSRSLLVTHSKHSRVYIYWLIFTRIGISRYYYSSIIRIFCSALLPKWENVEDIHTVNFKTLQKHHLIHSTNHIWTNEMHRLINNECLEDQFWMQEIRTATTDFRIFCATLVEIQMLECSPYSSLQSDHLLWLNTCYMICLWKYMEIEESVE